jgi:hypothetical protein
MPRFLAVDVNVVSGTVHLENTKTTQVDFKNAQGQPVAFTLAPRLQLTLLDQTNINPYKVSNVKTGNVYTGFIIGFSNKVTLDVEWEVSERA